MGHDHASACRCRLPTSRSPKKRYAPNRTNIDLEKIERDPFLIAAALRVLDRVVVTREVSKPSKHGANRKILHVSQTFGVPCINDFAMWRKPNFSID